MITITITGENAAEALSDLRLLSAGLSGTTHAPVAPSGEDPAEEDPKPQAARTARKPRGPAAPAEASLTPAEPEPQTELASAAPATPAPIELMATPKPNGATPAADSPEHISLQMVQDAMRALLNRVPASAAQKVLEEATGQRSASALAPDMYPLALQALNAAGR